MRGSPLLRALLAFAVILGIGWPLSLLTEAGAPLESAPAPVAAAVAARDVMLKLTFSSPPSEVSVRHLGREIWKAPGSGDEMEHAAKIPFPDEGVDLEFIVSFPEPENRHAMRVQLTDPAGDEHERTAWGRGTIEEVLTFR